MHYQLKVEGLSKVYRVKTKGGLQEIYAVRGLSFEVGDGEVFTLLGPSGCGKSTTLRCIAGLEEPDEGEITIQGKTVYSSEKKIMIPPEERRVGMVFQSYTIWPHMNVFENVAYPLKARKIAREEIVRKVKWALGLVKLDGMEERPATKLSGGQQQRVALARALVAEPSVLLLDEPLSNLDARVREELRDELRSLLKSLGIAVVYVTHDQVEAFAISDRLGLMNEGVLIEVKSPVELYFRPETRFAAEFLGSANILEGEIVGDGVVDTPLGRLHLSRHIDPHEWGKVHVCFRAESVILDPVGRCTGQNTFIGLVVDRKFLGVQWELALDVNGVTIRVRVPSYIDLQVGARVCMKIENSSLSIIKR